MAVGSTKVVQVTNIAPQATKDQMQTLFGFLGKIEDIRLYPTIRDVSCPVQSRICYIKFMDSATASVAEHMTNTVFIDRALIVIPVQSGDIPDEYYALEMTRNGTIVPGLNVNEPKMPAHVTNSLQGSGANQVIVTSDPQLDVNGVMPYPPLPSNYDNVRVEETRRTIYVENIDPTTEPVEIIDWFNSQAGEVKYVRGCENSTNFHKAFLIEFSEQPSVIKALLLDGQISFKEGSPLLRIQHATQPIAKPQAKTDEAAQKEIEEAMTRFKEAQNMINASIEPVIGLLTKDKRTTGRSRSRSHDRSRRRHTRSRSHSRRRSRSRRRRSRSKRSRSRKRRSRSRKRSRSRSHRRSRSRSRRRSKHRTRSRDRKSRDKSRDRRRRSKDRKSSSSKHRDRKVEKESSTEGSGNGAEKSIEKGSSEKGTRSRSRSRSEKRRSRSKERKRDKDRKRDRSKSRGRSRRTPTPKSSRKRSRSRSRDRKRDRRDRDKESRKRDRSRSSSKTHSKSKVSRNYDDERDYSGEAKRDDVQSNQSIPKTPPFDRVDELTPTRDAIKTDTNMDISNSP